MDIEISTSDPENVDPADIARILVKAGGYYVHTVSVNDGERYWGDPDAEGRRDA